MDDQDMELLWDRVSDLREAVEEEDRDMDRVLTCAVRVVLRACSMLRVPSKGYVDYSHVSDMLADVLCAIGSPNADPYVEDILKHGILLLAESFDLERLSNRVYGIVYGNGGY